jgi:hypothetical protein
MKQWGAIFGQEWTRPPPIFLCGLLFGGTARASHATEIRGLIFPYIWRAAKSKGKICWFLFCDSAFHVRPSTIWRFEISFEWQDFGFFSLILYYDFCWIHQSLRVTPAMEAGLAIMFGQSKK